MGWKSLDSAKLQQYLYHSGTFIFQTFLTLLTQDIFKKYQLFIPLWTLARKGKVTLAVKNRIGGVIFVKEMLLGDWNFKKSEDEGNNVRKL